MTVEPAFDAALLALLCCPETRQPLVVAPADLLARMESARVAGKLTNRAGVALTEPITAGLLRVDGAVFFPVSGGIPLLVPGEAVMVPHP
jgi:uncharacterized protein